MVAPKMNSDTGRLALAAGGGALTACGLRRFSLSGLLMAGAGGYLVYRALRAAGADGSPAEPSACGEENSAACENPWREKWKHYLDVVGAGVTAANYEHLRPTTPAEQTGDDPVLAASDASFPASDPPGWAAPTKEPAGV